jgi:hypothetical protein
MFFVPLVVSRVYLDKDESDARHCNGYECCQHEKATVLVKWSNNKQFLVLHSKLVWVKK